jgi:hypothetical protein
MERRVIRWTVGLVAFLGLASTILAGITIWLLITDPVAVSSATADAEAGPLLRLVGGALVDALLQLLKYI